MPTPVRTALAHAQHAALVREGAAGTTAEDAFWARLRRELGDAVERREQGQQLEHEQKRS